MSVSTRMGSEVKVLGKTIDCNGQWWIKVRRISDALEKEVLLGDLRATNGMGEIQEALEWAESAITKAPK